jgi:putative sigma-54 modulation protein
MLVNIQSRQFSLTPALRAFVESKVKLTLGRYETKISRVDVSLFDINGPKGGEDKCCKMIVRVKNLPCIVVQETTEDLYEGINICSRRTRRAVKRQLSVTSKARGKMSRFLSMPEQDELSSNMEKA